MKRTKGNKHATTKAAYRKFKKICKQSRAALQHELPEILKYKPKQFW